MNTDTATNDCLDEIDALNRASESKWASRLTVDKSLTRPLVSFQANKHRAVYRWFKYKEAFSAGLVEHFLTRYKITKGKLLDPFAGSGTALFAAGSMGLRAEGIELLPIGQSIIATKDLIDRASNESDIANLSRWIAKKPWNGKLESKPIPELKITQGAYPAETSLSMGRYLTAMQKEDDRTRSILTFALLSVLESISFTRKDGQYLRWDHRSGRRQGKKIFDKGAILSFDDAMNTKLSDMVADLSAASRPQDLFATEETKAEIELHSGSCLDIMPKIPTCSFDCLITSPPYCNRYDYTRTYALELALLGVDAENLVRLRQAMVSCTVENRSKDLLAMNPNWRSAIAAADGQPLLQRILKYLDTLKELDQLNNSGIPRMVRGYFYEMSCVISEAARVLKPGAYCIVVNDNVRYAGAAISVDIILSEIAERLGFRTEQILVLPNGKGNSSQQMGAHGREPLRKCVYVWRRE
jgi:DNA modification methylase